MDIGVKIKNLRSQKNLGQVELAKILGISDASISSYEIGRTKPSLKVIHKMADVFGVDVAYLIGESTSEIQVNTKDSSLTEKLYNELKSQFEFLQRNFERVIEENGRLSRTLENITSSGNFRAGNSYSALWLDHKAVTPAA